MSMCQLDMHWDVHAYSGISRYANLYRLYLAMLCIRRETNLDRSIVFIILSNAAIYADDQILESLMQAIF